MTLQRDKSVLSLLFDVFFIIILKIVKILALNTKAFELAKKSFKNYQCNPTLPTSRHISRIYKEPS
jgi:hypothetical protein